MKLLIKMAWRSLLRNKRRSLITSAAIFFAVLMTVAMRGMQTGVYSSNIKNSIELFTGYMQIQLDDFNENQGIRKAYKLDAKILSEIENQQNVVSITRRLISNGLIGKGNKSVGAGIIAIDPNTESKTSEILKRKNEGQEIDDKRKDHILVGWKMLKNIKAQIGDTVVILVNAFDGSMGNMKFIIGGTIKTGISTMDKMSIIMHIDTANELFSMYGKYHTIAIKIDDLKNIDNVKKDIQDILDDNELSKTGINLLDWEELLPDMVQQIKMDKYSGFIFLGFLILIVAFGILNTISMSITERFNEFGVMLALGTKNVFLVKMVFFETIFLSLIGIVAGIIPGYILNWYYTMNPIQLTGDMAATIEEFGWKAEMSSSVDPQIFINVTLIIFTISIIVFIIPAIKLMRLQALKGIRYT